jgi:hypothetical protein
MSWSQIHWLCKKLDGRTNPKFRPGFGDQFAVERITEKIVRGIYYIEDSIFIEPPYEITFYALPENGIAL